MDYVDTLDFLFFFVCRPETVLSNLLCMCLSRYYLVAQCCWLFHSWDFSYSISEKCFYFLSQISILYHLFGGLLILCCFSINGLFISVVLIVMGPGMWVMDLTSPLFIYPIWRPGTKLHCLNF